MRRTMIIVVPGPTPGAVLGTVLGAALGLCGAGCGPAERQNPDAAPAAPCALDSEAEHTPGFPFDSKAFRDQVWPILDRSCATAGCHLAPSRASDAFELWPISDDACDFARSFNAVYRNSDFKVDPASSAVYTAATGAMPEHPALATTATLAEPERAVLLGYISAARDAYASVDTLHPSVYFDFQAYQTAIHPMLESAGCLEGGCHDPGAAAGGFSLHVQPALDSPEMEQSFRAAVEQVAFAASTGATPLHTRATDDHAGARLSSGDAQVLQQWIEEGLAAIPDTAPGCANPDAFDVDVFRDEIMPVLNGDVDLNDRGGGRNTIGCTRSVCHGQSRGPGTLYLHPAAAAADNLKRFACFVEPGNASTSQILVCPLNSPRCATGTHPGDDIFSGVQDRNFQRILSFIYAANSSATPLDFAFYARRIGPIFDDPGAVQNDTQGLTCANTQLCHGTLVPGEPPNGSNFGLIPEPPTEQDLLLNFVSAANFAHFLDPGQSSLFLYPTGEIANPENDLATGLPHPGGENFDPDAPQALAILQWADGLRPDEQGFQRHWLVAGDFPASQVTDEKIPDERSIRPRIFEPSGQTVLFHNGQWDGFFSDQAFVDLNDPEQGFFRATAFDRLVYAVAYVINTSSRDIDAILTVRSPNEVQIFAGEEATTVGLGAPGATVTATLPIALPSYGRSRQLTRVMVKVRQRAGDTALGFDMQITGDTGKPLSEDTRELVIKLGPEGGI